MRQWRPGRVAIPPPPAPSDLVKGAQKLVKGANNFMQINWVIAIIQHEMAAGAHIRGCGVKHTPIIYESVQNCY